MAEPTRNVFISHRHEDDDGLQELKRLVKEHGVTWRDYSITSDNPNNAHNEDYIKWQILAPRIRQASCLVVYISEKAKNSEWVNWEIEYAQQQGKRIVGVWARGDRDCDIPEALEDYSDALVGWNGENIVAAISGTSDESYKIDGTQTDYRRIARYACR